MPFSVFGSAFYPEQVRLMAATYDAACATLKLGASDTRQRERLALIVMSLYSNGLTSGDELARAAVARFASRSAPPR